MLLDIVRKGSQTEKITVTEDLKECVVSLGAPESAWQSSTLKCVLSASWLYYSV